jgi:RNA polymerase sigma-70 factor (ECF subfamily)
MDTDVETDEALAERASRRDDPRDARHAFGELYDRHARRLLAFLAGRVREAAVEDVAQDVWQKVWQALPTGFRGGSFRSWLYAIARNAITDHLRRRKADAMPEEANLADHRHRPADEELAEAELRDALAHCLEKLERAEPRVAELVRARVGGESYDDFCARSGMAADKAYRAFHQAKAQLQACVEKRANP